MMSVKSAKNFIQKCETDGNFKARLEAAPDNKTRMQIIRAAGFEFTEDEFKEAAAELAATAGKELTPAELREIAGGLGGKSKNSSDCWTECEQR
jgi:predicted ribosomally synthesized peptide with nif11-like leader